MMKSTSRFAPAPVIPALLLARRGAPARGAGAQPPPRPRRSRPTRRPKAADSGAGPPVAAGCPAATAAAPQRPAAAGRQVADRQGGAAVLRRQAPKAGDALPAASSRPRSRTAWGIDVDVVKEDDKFFYYKVYRPTGRSRAGGRRRPRRRRGAKKIAAAYQVETPESQRLSFVPFSTGLPDQRPVAQRLRHRRHERRRPPGHRALAGAQGARPAGRSSSATARGTGGAGARRGTPACPTTTATPRWGTSTATAIRTSRSASTCAG